MATILNTSNGHVHPGDLLEWTFECPARAKKLPRGPRRIGIKVWDAANDAHSPKLIGRALSFAKSGEPLDILISTS